MENKKQTKHRKKHRCKKVVLQIAMACALLCSVVRWMPDIAQASVSAKLEQSFPVAGEGIWKRTWTFTGDSTIMLFCVPPVSGSSPYNFYAASKRPFTYSVEAMDDEGETWTYQPSQDASSQSCDHYNFYCVSLGDLVNLSDCTATISGKYVNLNSETMERIQDSQSEKYKFIPYCFIGECLFESRDQWSGHWIMSDEAEEGSKDNPIKDADIGTLIISGKALNQDMSKNIDGLSNDFSSISDQLLTTWTWKNKTSTGFSLSKNKYARTFIQVKVESRCLVYKNLKHTEIKEKWNSYGERATLYTELPVEQNPKVIYLTDVLNALPNTKAENHNILYSGMNFRYYWRVVCTDDLAVIPSDTAKWYSGGWRAVDLNMDSNTSKEVNDASNGHFDEDGKWVDDEDDGYNDNINDSSGEVDDVDDAKDKVVEKPSSTGDDFSWNDFKSLINQCKQVPDLIKGIFSFLPDWVLKFVAVGFGIWIFVLIKRAIV